MSWFRHLRAAGRPIAYYPQLAKPLGGVNAVILFSHFLYWNERSDCALGVYKSAAEIEDETGLSVQEQRTARKRLRDLGVLIETEKRIEHRIYFRLDEAAFDALMDETFANESCNIPEMQNQHSGSDDSTFADEGFNTRGVAIQRSFKEQKTTSENYQETTAEMGVCADAPPAPEPSPPKPKRQSKADEFVAFVVARGVDEATARDWWQYRAGKPMTESAWQRHCTQAEAAGISVQEAAAFAAGKEWRAFYAEGYQREQVDLALARGQPPQSGRTFDQTGREVSPAGVPGMPVAGFGGQSQRTSKMAQGISLLEELKDEIRRGEV